MIDGYNIRLLSYSGTIFLYKQNQFARSACADWLISIRVNYMYMLGKQYISYTLYTNVVFFFVVEHNM